MPRTVADPTSAPSFFWPDEAQGLTYEQLKARRALAAQLAAKARDYPNTLGKGIFSFSESMAQAWRDRKLDAQERKIREGDTKADEELRTLNPSYRAPAPPPAAPAGPAAAPPPTAGPTAALDPEIDLSRAQMVEALVGGAEGSQAAGPGATRMAALPTIDTMSDAGQAGLTYGGPSPAGPGASMAERPDQAPPAPSAPPAGMASPGPVGTPVSGPVAGGGVPPMAGPAGMTGPLPMPVGGPGPAGAAGGQGPGPSRDMLAATLQANQAFNPDAAGSGPAVPPQMLAQVGGFGGSSAGLPAPPTPAGAPGATGLPALPPSAPGSAPPPGGVRPGATPSYIPMSEGEATRRYGPAEPMPGQWDPAEHARYRRAIDLSNDPNRSAEFRRRAADTAKTIDEANSGRFKQAEDRAKSLNTRRQQLIDEGNKLLWGKQEKASDPIEQEKARDAAFNARLREKTGLPAERLFKDMDERHKVVKEAASRQEDNQIVLDALKSGLPITGKWAEPRLEAAKFAAWATANPQLAARAGSTELLRAKLLNGVSQAIAGLKPISNIEVQLGQRMVGDISQQPETLKAIVEQNTRRNNEALSDYDTRAHRAFAGEGAIADTYESPKATWMEEGHVKLLLEEIARNPARAKAEIAEFNSSYGPGSAEFAINRQKLRMAVPPR